MEWLETEIERIPCVVFYIRVENRDQLQIKVDLLCHLNPNSSSLDTQSTGNDKVNGNDHDSDVVLLCVCVWQCVSVTKVSMADAHTHVSKLPRVLYHYGIAAIENQAYFSLFLRHALHFSGVHGENMYAHNSDPKYQCTSKK